jgi:tetratricopeptide (TPR) repeat protein
MDLRVNRTLLLFLFLVPGLAGIPAAIAEDNLGVAKAHYNKAARLYDVGEYRQALDEFKAAHVAKPDPAFLFNIAQCHRQLGDLEQAIVMYRRYLGASPKAANRDEVEKRMAEIEATLAAQKLKAQGGPAVAPPPTAVAPAPMATQLPAAPAPTESVTAPGTDVTVAPQPGQPSGSSLRYLRWVGVGVTLALAGGAIATGLSASSKFDDLKGSCGSTSAGCARSDIDGVKSRALVTNLLWGATGVAAIATGLAFYLTPHESAVQVAWRY